MGSWSVWHWLVLIIPLAVIAILVRSANRREAGMASDTAVRGWLALLVVGLMFLGPLIGAGRINADLVSAERDYPHLLALSQWATYKGAVWICYGVAAIVSIYAGSRLAYTTKRRAVKIGIAGLWISGPVASLTMGLVLPAIIFGQVDGAAIPTLVPSLVAAGIWTAYLLKSKRVAGRYTEASGYSEPVAAVTK